MRESTLTDEELLQLAGKLGEWLTARGDVLVSAESCTGGWIAKTVTDVAGSSVWFDRGFVTYSDEAKREMLGVSADTLDRFGAVSEAVAREMAEGALARSAASMAISVTGIAGPAGGGAEKPLGTVWFGRARRESVIAWRQHFDGDRETVRRRSVAHALGEIMNGAESV